jgi:hypothetical protein
MTPMKYITPATFELLRRVGRLSLDHQKMLTRWPPTSDAPDGWVEESPIVVREHQAFDWGPRGNWRWVP